MSFIAISLAKQKLSSRIYPWSAKNNTRNRSVDNRKLAKNLVEIYCVLYKHIHVKLDRYNDGSIVLKIRDKNNREIIIGCNTLSTTSYSYIRKRYHKAIICFSINDVIEKLNGLLE